MSKHLVVMLLSCAMWALCPVAEATVMANPDLVDLGTVDVGMQAMVNDQLSDNSFVGETIQSFDVSAPSCQGLSVLANLPATVAAGFPLNITVVFAPVARGAVNCNIRILSASGAQIGSFTAVGTGVAAVLTATPSPLAFGNVLEGNMAMKTLTVKNTGDIDATVTSATITPPNIGYTLVLTTPVTVSPGNSIAIPVTFAPMTGGIDGGAATLTIASNALGSPTSVPITGTGLSTGFSVTCPQCAGNPLALAYGDVRWDNVSNEVFTITNSGTASLNVITLDLTSSLTGTFTIANPPALPKLLTAGQSLTITVAATSQNVLGAETGQLQVATDLPANNTKSCNLSVNFVSPVLAITPGMVVDFGAVDVHTAGGSTISVMLQNTGDAAMNILASPGVSGALFTGPPITAQTVAAGASVSIDVTYQPVAETSAASPDTGTLVVDIDGLFSTGNPSPSAITINLTGHGADRHIQLLGAPVTFPGTYRNLSAEDAPVQAVTVSNTGDAPLVISALTLTGDPAFTLVETAPITVAGGSMSDVHVRFAPTTDSGTFTASLVIANDDTADPSVTVPIGGSAVARSITLSPSGNVDFGETHLGDSLHETLMITNTDPSRSVRVRALQSSSADFTAAITDPQMLGPGDTASFDLVFTPSTTGEIDGSLDVLFDDDSMPDGTITLTGHGLSRRGAYYACSAGTPGSLAIVLVAIALLVRRRRR